MFFSKSSAFTLRATTVLASLVIFGSPVLATPAEDKAMAACPVGMRVTEDDVLNGRVKPYVIEPSESALLLARSAFFNSSTETLLAMASAEKDLKDTSFGSTPGGRIDDTIGICNMRKELELIGLTSNLINERFGRLPAGTMSVARAYMGEAISDAFTVIMFPDRFTPAQIQAYYGPYSLLLPLPKGPANPADAAGTVGVDSSQQQIDVVRRYYSNWHDGNVGDMWQMLSPAFRSRTSHEAWLKGHLFDKSVSLTHARAAGYDQVTATVVAVDESANGVTSSNTYRVTWTLIAAHGGGWLLDSYTQ